jgi:hypothetical protein
LPADASAVNGHPNGSRGLARVGNSESCMHPDVTSRRVLR